MNRFAFALGGLVIGVLIGFLLAREKVNPAKSQPLFDRRVRCQQIAQQLQREESKEYDYLQYEDIAYSAKRDSCVASVLAIHGSLEIYVVEDLLSQTTLWSDSCGSKDCYERRDALAKAQKEQLAKF